LSLGAGCRRHSQAEKEVIVGWILVGNHPVKDNEWFSAATRSVMGHNFGY